MTQHPPPATDRKHPIQHPLDVANTPLDQEARPGPSRWWLGLLALLPIACCVGLPLLFAAGVTAGSGVVLGGVAGGALMLAGAAVLGIWGMRRRRTDGSRPADTSTATPPKRDQCC